MSRCKACNTPFMDSDYPKSDHDAELCSYCRHVSDNSDYLHPKEYQFENITEIPVYVENYQNTVDK